jgi:hypothetical protein
VVRVTRLRESHKGFWWENLKERGNFKYPVTDGTRVSQIPGARSARRLNFFRSRLIFLGTQYGTAFMSPICRGGLQVI